MSRPAGVVLAVLYLLLGAAALRGSVLGLFLVLAAVAAEEELLVLRRSPLLRRLGGVQLGGSLRLVVRSGMVLVLVARHGDAPRGLLATTLAALVLHHALRTAGLLVQRTVTERSVWPLRWRHLKVPGLALPAEARVPGLVRTLGPHVVVNLDLVVVAGVALTLARSSLLWVAVASGVALVVDAAVALALRARARELPDRTREDVVAAVRDALEALAPRVVIYFGGPPSSTHALNVWASVLERLDVPVLVMVRQREHLERLASRRLPAVWAPRATDVEELAVPSLDLALYPTNIAQNNHLLRVPGILDVFVGHGDSDKGGSFTPLSRIYDEVWVAGPAGRDRYRLADVGVRDEQIREVGRPQLAEIARTGAASRPADAPFTILYAPTWEGFYATYSYSSLAVMGERLVAALLDLEGVRVLVKPHPASGSVDPRYAAAARAVERLARDAGPEHGVVSGLTGLYQAFNEADMLVTDVSSVVTDFLWSGKPYAMTNPSALPEDEYRARFPSSAGAALWTPDLATLREDVEDARTTDRRRAAREAVARYLLGPVGGDPVEPFVVAVAEALDRANSRKPARVGLWQQ